MTLQAGGGEYHIAPISARTFIDHRQAGKLIGRPTSFDGLEHHIEDKDVAFLTAETSEGVVLGHVGVNLGPSAYEPMQQITGERHGIGALAVAEQFRRQRVGLHLVQHSLGLLASEGNNAFLAVEVNNDPAIALYENLGFTWHGELWLPHDVGTGPLPVWQDKLCDIMVYDLVQ